MVIGSTSSCARTFQACLFARVVVLSCMLSNGTSMIPCLGAVLSTRSRRQAQLVRLRSCFSDRLALPLPPLPFALPLGALRCAQMPSAALPGRPPPFAVAAPLLLLSSSSRCDMSELLTEAPACCPLSTATERKCACASCVRLSALLPPRHCRAGRLPGSGLIAFRLAGGHGPTAVAGAGVQCVCVIAGVRAASFVERIKLGVALPCYFDLCAPDKRLPPARGTGLLSRCGRVVCTAGRG